MPAVTRLGLQIPRFSYPDVPDDRLFEKVAEIAATAESSGFDSVWVMDHLHQIPGVGAETDHMFEGHTMLAALAARTSRVNLGLMVGGVTYRNPALHAKITTGIDVISGGRAIHGIGAAWFEREHDAYGVPFPPIAQRFERLEDHLQIARGMFTQERFSFQGKHHHVHEVLNNPRPIRGDIPIMVGGSGERKTLRMVAQYANASNVFGDAAQVRHLMGVLEGHCETVGRDIAEITKTRLGVVLIDRDADVALARAEALIASSGQPERTRAMVMAGEPDSVAEQASELLDAGLDGLVFSMPDAHDSEKLALAGETLASLIAARS